MTRIFLADLLPVLLLLSTFGCSAEEDSSTGDTLDIIKSISLDIGQVNTKTQDLEYMIGGIQENQIRLEMEIENLKETSRMILNKLDQLLGSTGSGNDPLKENFKNIEQTFEKLNAKVDAIGDIIPNFEHAFKQELLIPTNVSVAFSVSEILPRDCLDVFQRINSASGVYKIYPDGNLWNSKEVLCKDGYTVILKRQETLKTHFNRTWAEYWQGFGSPNGEYYIGNNALHLLTTGRNQKLSILMRTEYNHEGIYNYSTFYVGNEETNFKLSVMGFSGSGSDNLKYLNGMMFSTLDRDNDLFDNRHTAAMDQYGEGGGWWYSRIFQLRATRPNRAKIGRDGIEFKEMTMMIKTN